MLDFIKGYGTSEYRELLDLKPEYNDAIYLDISNNRLYHAGKTLDVRVVVEEVLDDVRMVHQKYHFTNPNGEEVVIEDTLIPEIKDYTIVFHDISNGIEYNHRDGLLCQRDKFLLESMAKLLGITIKYTYWATVHSYSDLLNGVYDRFTEVEVYKNSDGEWQYDYDEFKWIWRDAASGQILYTYTVPAGQMLLQNDSTYITPKYVYVGEPPTKIELPQEEYTIPGDPFDEFATIRAKSLTMDRQSKDFNLYDGGNRPDDTSTLLPVGAMPVGVTVGELEQVTVSEVISRILFYDNLHYEKVCDTSIYIKYTDEYISTYGEKDYIKIGSKYPSVDELETVFTPETWQLYAGEHPIGDPVYTTQYVSTDYFISDGQHLGVDPHGDPDDPSTYPVDDNPESEYNQHLTKFAVGGVPHYCNGYLDHVVYSEVDRSVYYGDVHFNILDISTGEIIDSSYLQTFNYIGFEGYHSTHPDYEDTDSSFINSLSIGWPLLSNCPEVSSESNWNNRNIEPSEPFDTSTIHSWGLGIPNKVYYLKWPSATKPEDEFTVYLPIEGEIKECGGAHDGANEEYSAEQSAHISLNPDTSDGTYEMGYWAINVPDEYITHDFYKWVVDKAAVITNIRMTIGSVEG